MNKIFKSILAIACASMMVGGFAACTDSVNAYEIAVENGFQGTEEEWLLSLKGANGENGKDLTATDLYETAKSNGFEGTYIQFCEEVLKVDVTEDNDVDTIAQNVTSVVSVYCGFSKTVTYNNGFWGSRQEKEYYSAAGSGVIIDLNKEAGNALIVTNYHVIYDSASDSKNGISDCIWLYTYGALNGFSTLPEGSYGDTLGGGIKATFVGGALDYDIALLRVEGSAVLKETLASKATFGDSDDMQLGEKVFAIGNPEGEGIAVTEGIVSVESEYIALSMLSNSTEVTEYRVIRTDAAINGGNSGGALFNTKGELIGITNAKNASSDIDNMGYALPSTPVRRLCENILRNEALYHDGSVRVARLGITVQIVGSKAYYDDNGKLKIREEFAVVEVAKNSAGDKAKLAVGDKLKAIKIGGGEWFEFSRQYQLIDSLLSVAYGDVVSIRYNDSNGNEKEVSVTYDSESYFNKFS